MSPFMISEFCPHFIVALHDYHNMRPMHGYIYTGAVTTRMHITCTCISTLTMPFDLKKKPLAPWKINIPPQEA